ncbi:MAG: glucose PTS transporter subunit IIA [Sporolactobacillus sp.]
MIPYERQKEIVRLLINKDIIKIDELQTHLPNISMSTLRRDLKALESDGKIEYLVGGAVKAVTPTGELPMSKKTMLHSKKKEQIADRAAEEVREGESIYIDSGSNSALLLTRLLDKPITIYTTNTMIFNITRHVEAIVVLLGGRYNGAISSLSGTLTENNLRDLYFDKAFLGVNGVDGEKGVTTPNIAEATKKRLIKSNAKKTYLLCDSSKFHRNSTVRAFDLEDVILISDKDDATLSKHVPILVPRKRKDDSMEFFKKRSTKLYAPTAGTLKSIEKVNDQIFASKAMGDGFAVEPTNGEVFSPVKGTVTSVFPTKHAISIKTKDKLDILVHLGIDTVELNGQGFEVHVEEGDPVTPETKLVDTDLDFLASQNKPSDVIVIFTNLEGRTLEYNEGSVSQGDEIGQVE